MTSRVLETSQSGKSWLVVELISSWYSASRGQWPGWQVTSCMSDGCNGGDLRLDVSTTSDSFECETAHFSSWGADE